MESRSGFLYGVRNDFDFIDFVKKPSVILKILALIFSIVVFGCIATNVNSFGCPYVDTGACGFGTAIGVVAFMALVAFIVIEVLFENIINLDSRRYVVMAEMTFSALWSFMWFVGFCYLCDTWRRQEKKSKFSISDAQAAIAFSFFNIFVFVALAVLGFAKYKRGVLEDFMPANDHTGFGDNYNQDNGYYQSSYPSNENQEKP